VTFSATGVAGAAHHLVFISQPTNAVAGAAVAPAVTVEVQDQYNNTRLLDNTTSVTVAIGTNPGGGTLSGTLTVSAVSGVATFSDLSIEKTGIGYTLTAASSGLAGATSSTFDISADVLHHFDLVLATPQSNGVAFTGTSTLTAKDQFGNTVTTFDASGDVVTFTHDGAGSITGLSGTTALNSNTDFSAGVANLAGSFTYTNGGITVVGEDVHFSVSSASGKVSGSVLVHINQ
jgi:hypothetical protein